MREPLSWEVVVFEEAEYLCVAVDFSRRPRRTVVARHPGLAAVEVETLHQLRGPRLEGASFLLPTTADQPRMVTPG